MYSRNEFSVWSILKQCIGKELSKITMPVIFNEPLSFLQRIVEYMEYAPLLTKASMCDDPVQRLEYVTAFAMSMATSNWERVGKPFNPLLGETYELDREDLGFRIVLEQVSHHPPVSAFHADSPHFRFHGAIHPKLKFWGKSVEAIPKGTVCLELLKHDEVYTWSNVNCCIHNIIVGKLWIELYGVMEVVNQKTKQKAVLNFKQGGWFGKDLHKLEGIIYDDEKKKLRILQGKWLEALYSYDVPTWEKYQEVSKSKSYVPFDASGGDLASPDDQEQSEDVPNIGKTCNLNLPNQKLLWSSMPRPADSSQYYNFTLFAMMLNELRESQAVNLAPTDSRLRPDIRKLEEGDIDGASVEKNRLEEKQRAARKERKKSKTEWSPRWFKLEVNPYTGKEDWLFTKEYWERNWDCSPDIF